MGWHEAYLAQARSEYAVLRRLNSPGVEYAHRLHYLQMVTEKLAKGMQTPAGSTKAAAKSHIHFVRMLQALPTLTWVWRKLGYPNARAFRSLIGSVLSMAWKIERLAPDQAGLTKPNPEYPWVDLSSRRVYAPAEYKFPEFDPNDPRMAKIERLIEGLLRLTN
jgi:hypothetical protein